jgi:hypothetical protein
MIRHLSSKQISKLTIEKAAPEEGQHVRDCAECAAELRRVRETLSRFKDSVERWAERSSGSVVPDTAFLEAVKLPVFTRRPVRWALALAVLILVVTIPIYKNITDRQREAEVQDALLLELVNAQLSRTVPAPMEPLMELLSNGSADELGGRQ